MASKSSQLEQIGATPAKLALIGALAMVLVVVLYVQFGRSGEDLPSTARDPFVRSQHESGRFEAGRDVEPEVTAVSLEGVRIGSFDQWRPPKLPVVIEHDPFALPASFPQPRLTGVDAILAQAGDPSNDQSAEAIASLEARLQQSRADLESLRHLGVQVIIRQDEGYVAMIGDRTIHVGDEINGFTVIAIDSDGVRVARDIEP